MPEVPVPTIPITPGKDRPSLEEITEEKPKKPPSEMPEDFEFPEGIIPPDTPPSGPGIHASYLRVTTYK
ncbi:MAG: hypothetical protein OXR66_02760 [Candidatus Woesearchaeota archaeon]|nr:hypothetical protein [Candidatus Woesearchaeota archaeon]